MRFDHDVFFATLRGGAMFGSSFEQQQVDGLESLLCAWEKEPTSQDVRHFAYMLATTFHETAATMQPIEEYGKGEGHEYGERDPQTGQTYYGRGYVQLTWRDNYARATDELALGGADDLEWHASRALDPVIAYGVIAHGMMAGWFTGKKLPQYFNETCDDPVGARQIVNPDDEGERIAGYHSEYLAALLASLLEDEPEPPEPEFETITLRLTLPKGSKVEIVTG